VAGALGFPVHAALEEPMLGLFGAAGAAALAVAVALGRPALVAPAIVLVAAGYAATLVVRDAEAIDASAPFVASALLLVAELGYWSVELARTARAEPRVLIRRLAATAGLAAGALVLSAGVLAATAVPLGGGLAWNIVGVAAAAGAVAVIAFLAVRAPSAAADGGGGRRRREA
jgi:hypothetical protein